MDNSCREFACLVQHGVRNIAFYDDALLFRPEQILLPFLRHIAQQDMQVNLHTPNALNARFITKEIATTMVQAGFKTFFLGFESGAYAWQRRTGGKVYAHELEHAVEHLVQAGADLRQITAYLTLQPLCALPTALACASCSRSFPPFRGLRMASSVTNGWI
jgi:radical SAM superfamily enzyme YgiQ (UPF0313 family)